jgi:multiple sugar transport system permease protein
VSGAYEEVPESPATLGFSGTSLRAEGGAVLGARHLAEWDFKEPSGFGGALRRMFRWLDEPARLKRLLILPLSLLLIALVGFPFVMNLELSFTKYQANSPQAWYHAPLTGFGNYGDLIRDATFWHAVLRTFVIVGIGVLVEGVIGFGLALLTQGRFIGKRLYVSIFLIPMMVIPIVSGFIFYMLFQAAGPVNTGLLSPIFGDVSIPWLTNQSWALGAILIADIWQWTPLMFLIFSGGLAAIPPNTRDAASVLGANTWQTLRYVSLPLLRNIVVIAIIIRAIELFKIFDTVWLMTGGGPGNSTQTVSIFLYQQGAQAFNVAYTAAAAFLVLILIAMLGWFALKALRVAED